MSVWMQSEETFAQVLFVLCIFLEFGAIPASAADTKTTQAQTDSGTNKMNEWQTSLARWHPARAMQDCQSPFAVGEQDRWKDGDGQRDGLIIDDEYNASIDTVLHI